MILNSVNRKTLRVHILAFIASAERYYQTNALRPVHCRSKSKRINKMYFHICNPNRHQENMIQINKIYLIGLCSCNLLDDFKFNSKYFTILFEFERWNVFWSETKKWIRREPMLLISVFAFGLNVVHLFKRIQANNSWYFFFFFCFNWQQTYE